MTEKSSVEIFDENYGEILKKIEESAEKSGRKKDDITLLAATKTIDVDTINHAIRSGIDYIGENKVQEFLSKKDFLEPCHRHFIGHLQTNKVKDIVPFVELIHSVDSLKLAKEISKVSVKLSKTTDILLEINIENAAIHIDTFHDYEPCMLAKYLKEIPDFSRELTPDYLEQHGLTDLMKVVNGVPPLHTPYVPLNSIVREFVGGSCYEY